MWWRGRSKCCCSITPISSFWKKKKTTKNVQSTSCTHSACRKNVKKKCSAIFLGLSLLLIPHCTWAFRLAAVVAAVFFFHSFLPHKLCLYAFRAIFCILLFRYRASFTLALYVLMFNQAPYRKKKLLCGSAMVVMYNEMIMMTMMLLRYSIVVTNNNCFRIILNSLYFSSLTKKKLSEAKCMEKSHWEREKCTEETAKKKPTTTTITARKTENQIEPLHFVVYIFVLRCV